MHSDSLGRIDRSGVLRARHLFALATLASCAGPAGAQEPRRIIDAATAVVADDLQATVTTVQVGDNPNERFQIHHVRTLSGGDPSRAVVLLPPVTNGFDFYEIGPGGDYGRSLAGQLARSGFDVWGYTARMQVLADRACERPGSDCSVAADWGLQSIVDDAAFIRQQIIAAAASARPAASVRPILGGVSLGSVAAAAAINAAPDDYAGAFLIEGSPYSADPQVRQINEAFCTAADSALIAGVVLDGETLPGFRTLALLARVAPDDPSPSPQFSGRSNRQALIAALGTAQLNALQPFLGFFLLAGDPAGGTFTYADDDMVQTGLAELASYAAVRLVRDIDCSLAGDRTFTGQLHGFRGAIFAEQDGHGFGASVGALADLTSAWSVTRIDHPPYGHYDEMFAATRDDEWKALAGWMNDAFAHDAGAR